MAKKEKTFDVLVTRTSYSSRVIQVKASSEEEAKDKAIDEAGDHEFSEKSAEYTVDGINENK